jgi:hypothetical protein
MHFKSLLPKEGFYWDVSSTWVETTMYVTFLI